ncbi:MAG: signal peptidase I [Nanoarchaeota archaeon]|nr:signal peptidase I [Nanoarchaeota archaeon]MBU1321995.1 signal peptidase I [Nanoarchaeota archaeon]MBU1597985.1 signal peptidase I [Nanoarchaeota archaeon]MBU2441706.1 signal peptidase I [Nanoarchaeota archaeon]
MPKKKKPKTWYGKIWYFLWHDNSTISWIINIILAYLIIKFIIFPGIGLLFGTSTPVVSVISSSMEHNEQFDQWWAENEEYYSSLNITKADFEEFPFKNGFSKGDVIVLFGKNPEDIIIGDVIVFKSRTPEPYIHRVIKKEYTSEFVFQTKGDNNNAPLRNSEIDETKILENQILGRAALRIPWLGYIKIGIFELVKKTGLL